MSFLSKVKLSFWFPKMLNLTTYELAAPAELMCKARAFRRSRLTSGGYASGASSLAARIKSYATRKGEAFPTSGGKAANEHPALLIKRMATGTITPGDATPSAHSDRVPAYSWYALAVLTVVYVLNFLDRTLIYILFTPIKKEMAFTDLQLALLGSTSFVIFYTLLGIPFGRLADRTTRKYLIAGGLAVWSLFSGLDGFCQRLLGDVFLPLDGRRR